MLAFLVDAIVVGIAAFVVADERRSSARGRLRPAAGMGLVGGLLYHVLLEGTWGQTVGKRLLDVHVVRADGGPCTYGAAAIRTAFRFVDWLPAGYLVGLGAMAVTEYQQRLGDLAAGTRVVRGRPEGGGRSGRSTLVRLRTPRP